MGRLFWVGRVSLVAVVVTTAGCSSSVDAPALQDIDAAPAPIEITEGLPTVSMSSLMDELELEGVVEIALQGVEDFQIGFSTDEEFQGSSQTEAAVICTGRDRLVGSGGGSSCGLNEPNLRPSRAGEFVGTADGRLADTAVWLVPEGADVVENPI